MNVPDIKGEDRGDIRSWQHSTLIEFVTLFKTIKYS